MHTKFKVPTLRAKYGIYNIALLKIIPLNRQLFTG